MEITHGECGKKWTGAARAHCSGCHETFNRDSVASKHRVGAFGIDRRCVDPATVGLVRGDDGIWRGEPSEYWARG